MYNDYIKPSTTVTDVKAINNSIKNILMTPKGSLPGKPTFGSDIHRVIFSQLDVITRDTLRDVILNALLKWEPRINIDNIVVEEVPEYNKIIATIHYSYRDKGITINEKLGIGIN